MKIQLVNHFGEDKAEQAISLIAATLKPSGRTVLQVISRSGLNGAGNLQREPPQQGIVRIQVIMIFAIACCPKDQPNFTFVNQTEPADKRRLINCVNNITPSGIN